MAEVVVAVLGNIGSGKTEFIDSMKRKVGSRLLDMLTTPGKLSVCEEAPRVKEIAAKYFYPAYLKGDMRGCFAAEVELLYARKDQMMDVAKEDGLVILERTMYENRFVFMENMRRTGLMQSPFYESYCDIFEQLRQLVPIPDVIVYLRTSPDVVYKRMQERGRESEKAVPLEYLQSTHALYEEMVDNILPRYVPMYGVKLVRVNADDHLTDLALQKFHDQIEERIEHALRRQGWVNHSQAKLVTDKLPE